MWLLKLVRWKNLMMMAATMLLVRYTLLWPIARNSGLAVLPDNTAFWLLVVVIVLLSAAGYIVNDIYDLPIDHINKPNRIVIGRRITVNHAIALYVLFNIFAGAAAIWLSTLRGSIIYAAGSAMLAFGLWFYASRLKCVPVAGNIFVALLSLIIPLVFFFEYDSLNHHSVFQINTHQKTRWIVLGFTVFAFLTHLMREVIKDAEDLPGDSAYGCRTLPAVFGLGTARRFIIFASIFLIIILAASQVWLLARGYILPFMYALAVLQPLLFYMLIRAVKANETDDYARLSALSKIIMLAGMAGMILFIFY